MRHGLRPGHDRDLVHIPVVVADVKDFPGDPAFVGNLQLAQKLVRVERQSQAGLKTLPQPFEDGRWRTLLRIIKRRAALSAP
jgi:hypothetical protein